MKTRFYRFILDTLDITTFISGRSRNVFFKTTGDTYLIILYSLTYNSILEREELFYDNWFGFGLIVHVFKFYIVFFFYEIIYTIKFR